MQKGLKDVFITKDLLIFNNEDAVGSLAEEKEMILLIYEGEVIDATKFQKKHPGGAIILEDYNGYDISEIFNHPNAHKHSNKALMKLKELKIGIVDEDVYNEKMLSVYQFEDGYLDLNRGILDQLNQEVRMKIEKNGKNEQMQISIMKDREKQEKRVQFYDSYDKEYRLWYSKQQIGLCLLLISMICLVLLGFVELSGYQFGVDILIAFVLMMVEQLISKYIISLIASHNYKLAFLISYYQSYFQIRKYTTFHSIIPIFINIFLLLILSLWDHTRYLTILFLYSLTYGLMYYQK